jgi:hypothetical protein
LVVFLDKKPLLPPSSLVMEPEKPVTWTSSTETFHDDLDDVCLDENAKTSPEVPPPGNRPEVLSNIVHECLFVGIIAFAAASSVFFQRSIVIISAEIGHSLSLSPAEEAWLNGASGYSLPHMLLYVVLTAADLPVHQASPPARF